MPFHDLVEALWRNNTHACSTGFRCEQYLICVASMQRFLHPGNIATLLDSDTLSCQQGRPALTSDLGMCSSMGLNLDGVGCRDYAPCIAGEVNGKAGNLNNLLEQLYPLAGAAPETDLVAVFDCDQVCERDFLLQTLPLLKGAPDVALVTIGLIGFSCTDELNKWPLSSPISCQQPLAGGAHMIQNESAGKLDCNDGLSSAKLKGYTKF